MNFLMVSLIVHLWTVLDYDLACDNAARQFRTDTAAAQNFWLRHEPPVPHPGYASGPTPYQVSRFIASMVEYNTPAS